MKKYNAFRNMLFRQEGNTILITLMIMAILSVTGVYAISTSSTELQATSNYQTQKLAFLNADSGVQYTLRQIREDLNSDIDLEDIDPSDYAVTGLAFDIDPDGLPWTGSGPFSFTSTGQDGFGKGASFTIEVKFKATEEIADAFKYALLSEGDINISGKTAIKGDIHSNSDVTQKSGGGSIEGNVTAVGTATAASADPDEYEVKSDAKRVDVPEVTDEILAEWEAKADVVEPGSGLLEEIEGKGKEESSYSFNLGTAENPEDIKDKIIFVHGNLIISGHVISGTFIATGDILVKGSSQMDEGKIGTAMIAGGDITFDGSANSYGVFWSNGGFRQNGSSSITGSIVAGGGGIEGDLINIDINGKLTFTWSGDVNNSNLPSEYKVHLTSWADKELL